MAVLRVTLLLVAICVAAAPVLATSSSKRIINSPVVTLDQGKFIGKTANGINQFLGIPFAKPPVGDLRFRLPEAPDPYVGKYNSTAFGLSCSQQADKLALPSVPNTTLEYLESLAPQPNLSFGEDCLTVNVVVPANATPSSKLPVVVWIYGGAFETGSSANFDGTVIVNRSITLQNPVIYVSLNYRLHALGFLASEEVKEARVGNLGLWDQRLALRWVQKYICAFGGDPDQVTIWGQSAGAVSVSLQMLTNGGNTEGLFRAAFMHSGSPIPVGDITKGQPYYDFLVENTNCSGSSDTLECLREVPYEVLMDAVNLTPSFFSYQSLALVWQPYADGVFLVDHPQKLVQQGIVANIPFVTSDCDDEGTLFSLSQTNITTDAEFRAYLTEFFLINVTDADVDKVLTLYPQDPAHGSPFDTGTQNQLTPQFKRIAAFIVNKRLKSLPILGSAHSSDVSIVYGGQDLTDYLINFATKLDPNGQSVAQWPQYTTSSPQLLTLYDSPVPTNITLDTYRAEAIQFLTKIAIANPV